MVTLGGYTMPAGNELQMVMAVLMGISLAACAGLRAFLPLFAAGVSVRMGWWPVEPWFQWAGSNEALICFGIATLLEVVADKVPILDNALDIFHTVARPVAGSLVAIGAFSQISPTYSVALGIIVGAPIAGSFHIAKASTRAASTSFTAGIANPVLSALEDIVAVLGTFLALVAPLLTFIALILLGAGIYRWRVRKKMLPA